MLWLTAALCGVFAVGYGVKLLLAAEAASEARGKLLADVLVASGRETPDGDELQRLMAALKKLPDHDTARDALAAKARIQLARGQAEAAQETFGAQATQPGAAADEQALGARILLRVVEGGSVDGAAAGGLLAQAVDLAVAGHAASAAPADLFLAWQAAERAGRHEQANGFAQQLRDRHAGSPEQQFVAFALAFDGSQGPAAIDQAMVGLERSPAEGGAMRVFAQLKANEPDAAVRSAETALRATPGVGVVRWAAAVAFHACVEATAAGSPERDGWVRRRDEQLGWCLRQADVDDTRRQQIEAMRAVR